MRVFVSYSFNDSELYLLTLLVSKLREKGYIVQLSENNFLSKNYISSSDFFVGLITNNSESINSVYEEWIIAEKLGKNRILLIEEGIEVKRNDIKYIRFNRNNPNIAIQTLFREDKPVDSQNKIDDILTAGAVIAGIAALLLILGDKKK